MCASSFLRVRQQFEAPDVDDIPATVKEQIDSLNLSGKVKGEGDSVAIAVGSCGIANIAVIVKATVEALEALGCEPFIVPAKKWMPRLPFDQIDLLIVDYIGKDISGAGMDSNVIGRKLYEHCAAEKEFPKVTRILVRDLTPETHGNASGVGCAEYVHQRVVDQMHVEATVINCMTGNSPSGAMIPIAFPTDQICISKALETVS